MKYITSILLLIAIHHTTLAQVGINDALKEIEANSPTIVALKAQMDYQKAEARTELLPPNPTVEGGRFPAVEGAGIKYAWGVTQSFEFPTVYAKRNQLAKTIDGFAEARYNAARQQVLLDAKHTLLETIHTKRLLAEYRRRKAFARNMLLVIQKKVDGGQATAMDLNNARLRVAEARHNVREFEAKANIMAQRISVLNGGVPLTLNDTVLLAVAPADRNTLLGSFTQSDPRYAAIEQMIVVAEGNKSLVAHQGLPELNIGYQSEQSDSEHFRGFKAGLSIPLWGNTGKRRAAAVQVNAARVEGESQHRMLELEFNELYLETTSTKSQLDELRQALVGFSNLALLQRALEAGQVSVIDFFNEVTFLYGITDRVMELELEYAKLYAELHRFEL